MLAVHDSDTVTTHPVSSVASSLDTAEAASSLLLKFFTASRGDTEPWGTEKPVATNECQSTLQLVLGHCCLPCIHLPTACAQLPCVLHQISRTCDFRW